MFELPGYVVSGLSFLATLFVFIIGLSVAGVLVAFVMDVAHRSKRSTISQVRHNCPAHEQSHLPPN